MKTPIFFLIACLGLAILPNMAPSATHQQLTAQIAAQITATPLRSPTPTVTLTPTLTLTPSLAPTFIATSVPNFISAESALWTPPAPVNRVSGNFLFGRPFAFQHNTYWSREYSYGSTKRGQLQVHHGLDFSNPSGVAVLAVADGVVYYAGPDVGRMFGPRPDFYGILVVIEHPYMYSTGQKIYTLYGHLRQEAVYTGQAVKAGQVIGYVGATGVALGPHLHFEVRVGDPESYDATRNPELWLTPYEGNGVVAGVVRDIYGNKLPGVQLELQAPGNNHLTFSYSGTRVNGDNRLGENFVFADISSGYYYLIVKGADGGLAHRQLLYVWPGQVTFVEVFLMP
jgi:murein DD-endopeptidase MepM/ murein hydrolase activator NlpD